MRKKTVITLISVVIFLSLTWGSGFANVNQRQVDRPQFVPDEVLVKFKADVSVSRIDEINKELNTQVIRRFSFIHLHQLKLPEGISVEEAIRILSANPIVEYAVPNGLYYLDVTNPNDPDFGELWGLHNLGQGGGTPDADIDAPEAWDITTGNEQVVIAVIDSGVDLDHEDLAGNIWTNSEEVPANGIDDDNNGYVDDVHGWDFSSNDNDPSPAGGGCLGHGTHVAGTIGAVGNNDTGVVGVNWNVKIMPLKAFRPVLGILCSASDADLIAAIEYHTMMGVRISSNSWGGGAYNEAMRDAILASNSVFVAAAGNGGLDAVGDDNDATPHYPSNYPIYNLIAVAAIDRNDDLAGFSNFGLNSVDLGAPGVAILSTLPDNTYGAFSGTSMATPHVAGVVGLLLAQDPDLTINEIKWRLLRGTDNTALPVRSRGRLNAYTTLQFGLSLAAVTSDVAPMGPTDVSPGDPVSFQLSLSNTQSNPIDVVLRIYLRFEDGRALSLGELAGTLGPGMTISGNVSNILPASVPTGIGFRIFAQAETSVSFDEDWVAYNVVP